MSVKMQHHCSIMQYVAEVDPKLHKILTGTCTDRSVDNGKNRTGTTFIMPNEALVEKLLKLVNSSKADDVREAADIINAHVIRIPLKSATDWNTAKDNIPNSIYPSQIVEIEKATGDEVHFKSGAVAKLDKKFSQFNAPKEGQTFGRHLVVYTLVKGELPVTKDKPAKSIKLIKNGGRAKTGGYALTQPIADQTPRFKIAIAVENDYLLNKLQLANGSGSKKCVYSEYVLGLVHHMLSEEALHGDLVEKVIPMLSGSVLDFYLLVEPHRKETNMLLDDSVISSWWSGARKFKGSFADLQDKLCALTVQRPEACFSDVSKLHAAVDDVRENIPNSVQVAETLVQVYKDFVARNCVGDVTNVYPEALLKYYQSNPGLKLIHDECRYLCTLAFERLERGPFSRADYEALLNTIGDYLVESGRNKLLSPIHFKVWIQPTHQIDEALIFTHSTAFLYFNSLGTSSDFQMLTHKPDELTDQIFNPFHKSEESHQRLFVSEDGLVDALRKLALPGVEELLAARGL